MNIVKKKNNRGLALYESTDLNGQQFSIQKSSLATEDAIWFGVNNVKPKVLASKLIEGATGWVEYPLPEDVVLCTKMHFNREQIKELLPILKKFIDTGEID